MRYKKKGNNFLCRNADNSAIDVWLNEKLNIQDSSKYQMIYNTKVNDKSDKTMIFDDIPQNTIIAVYAVPKKVSLDDSNMQNLFTPNYDMVIFRCDGKANLVIDGQLYNRASIDHKMAEIWHDDFLAAQKEYNKQNNGREQQL